MQPVFSQDSIILDFEVAAIGDDIDRLGPQDFAGRLAVCVSRPMSTTWLDQLVLRVDRQLNVVADADAPAIGSLCARFRPPFALFGRSDEL